MPTRLNHSHEHLTVCIKHYYPELLTEVKMGLKQDPWVLTAYRSKQLDVALEQFHQDLLRLLKDAQNFQGVPSGRPFALDEARHQVRFHFLVEKLFIQALRKRIEASDKEWMKIYYDLTQIFHGIQRERVALNCAHCRHAIEEDLGRARKMEESLKRVLSEGD